MPQLTLDRLPGSALWALTVGATGVTTYFFAFDPATVLSLVLSFTGMGLVAYSAVKVGARSSCWSAVSAALCAGLLAATVNISAETRARGGRAPLPTCGSPEAAHASNCRLPRKGYGPWWVGPPAGLIILGLALVGRVDRERPDDDREITADA